MPKHIKICKHPDTKRFYVSDVTDFESVWVSLHAKLYMGLFQSTRGTPFM